MLIVYLQQLEQFNACGNASSFEPELKFLAQSWEL